MTTTQQTKIAELLINKLNAAHKQAFEEILPPTVLQNQIEQKMVLAGVVLEMLKDAYTNGWQDGFRNGKCRGDGNYSRPNRAEFALEDFDNFLNNIKCTTHENK
jgi:hypothetical protein